MSSPTIQSDPNTSHSKAFENFVKQPDDIVGLLGYALYKKNINERKAARKPISTQDQRDPEATELDAYRGRAENLLRAFAQEAIDRERAPIIAAAISSSFDDVRREIKRATGFWWPGVVVGVVAWAISIILTIIVALSLPDWVAGLVKLITKHS